MDTPVPDTFNELDAEALDALAAALTSEFDAKYEGDTPAPVEELAEIAEALDSVRAEQTIRAENAEADAVKRSEIADRIRPVAEVEVVEEAAEVVAEEAAEEIVAEEAPVEVVEEVREPVAASAARRAPSARRTSSQASAQTAPPASADGVQITVAADVPGFASGSTLDTKGVAEAMHRRARGLADGSPRLGVASVALDIPAEHRLGPDSNADEVIQSVVASGLNGGNAASLVASGGWCAPSETMYDTFGVESRDGLLDLPTVGVSRGGLQVPSYWGISDATGALWTWTEATDITPGGSTKTCLQIPCPTWTDYRLEAEGLCVTHGNLSDRAFPEGTTRFIDLVMTAHLHRISNASVAKIIATATAVTVATAPTDAAGDILNAIDLQVADYRSEHLMGSGQVIDALFPQWFLEAIRSTLAMRAGVESYNISNAEVVGYFTTRNVRPQFLSGYEALFDTTPATAWPATSKFVMYPAGSYVKGDGGSIDLGVVRDSTLNETNDFTAAWSEQFYQIIQRGPAAREVTVTTTVNGITGGPAAMPIAA